MPNEKYWKERMEALEDMNYKEGRDYTANVEKKFRMAMKNIEDKINYWYARIADNNEITMQGAKRLLRADELEEFKWSVEEYIKKGESLNYSDTWKKQLENASAKVHISRLEALKMQMQQECEVLYGNMADGLDDTLRSMYTNSYYHTAYEMMKGYGVGWAFNRLDDRRIEKAINTVWANDGKKFSDRVWANKTKLVQELNTVLTQNIIRGESPQRAIAQLAKRMDVSKYRAGTLIMTESAFIHSQSQKDCFHDLDVERFEFVATLDSHTSEICQAMDGVIIDMADYKIGLNVPPLHPRCRSCVVPYYEDNDGMRAARGADGKTYLVPSDMKYEDWKKSFVGPNGNKSELQVLEIENSQEYRPMSRSNIATEITRGNKNIIMRQVDNSTYGGGIYVSDSVKLKPKQMHNIETALNDSVKIIGGDNLPTCMIISSTEMQTGAVCAYNATTNIIYIDSIIGDTDKLLELQKDMVCPNNPLSTYIHELLHWKTAESFRRTQKITDQKTYLESIRKKSKNKLDKLERQGYNIFNISTYASDRYAVGMYDETLTEYEVLQLLGSGD